MKTKISRPRRVSLGLIIISIAAIILGLSGFFVYQGIFQPKPENEIKEQRGISAAADKSEEQTFKNEESVKNGSWQKLNLISNPPLSHQLKVPLYQQNNFCYGASAMMIARYWGLAEEETQRLRQLMISGEGLMGPAGAPPIIVPAFAKFNLGSFVYLGYLKDSGLNPLRMWTHAIADTDEQVKTFASADESLLYLKRLIASNIPVIAIIEWDLTKKEGEGEAGAKDDHFTVVVGYDENHIYTNDSSPDRGGEVYVYTTADFLKTWNLRGTTSRQAAFLGDYGMIFLRPKE